MSAMNADPVKPVAARPRVLRQRSQSAVIKSNAFPDASNTVDSDASKRSSVRHRHAHSHHHIPHHPKRFAKDILGLQNGHSLAELSKQSSKLPEAYGAVAAGGSKDVTDSRKGSVTAYNLDGAVVSMADDGGAGEEMQRMVMEEQWNNKLREDELKATLHGLSEESMRTTRRLDDLYYNLLEKVSGLQSTISNLQELSGLTARLHGQFRRETGELATDMQKQIDAFAGFKTQHSKIEALDERVKESKQRADGLSERLEAARKRVSELEVREKKWQDSVNRRLRWMWIILGTVAGIVLAVYVLHFLGYGSEQTMKPSSAKDQATVSLESLTSVPTSVKSILEDIVGTQINSTVGQIRSSARSSSSRISWSRVARPPESTTPADRDPLMRIFDEL